MALLYNAAGQYPAAVGAIERAYTTLGTMTRDDESNNWTRQECATRVASGAITANRFLFCLLLSTSNNTTKRGLAAYRRQLATSKDDAEALKAILKWKTSAE